jgi:hypothetical protein
VSGASDTRTSNGCNSLASAFLVKAVGAFLKKPSLPHKMHMLYTIANIVVDLYIPVQDEN